MDRLFVYGIFLGAKMREKYGMHNPYYATVPNYITVGQHIVQAVSIPAGDHRIALTGLIVDVEPQRWDDIDRLEHGYDRILVKTDSGEKAYMYAAPEED